MFKTPFDSSRFIDVLKGILKNRLKTDLFSQDGSPRYLSRHSHDFQDGSPRHIASWRTVLKKKRLENFHNRLERFCLCDDVTPLTKLQFKRGSSAAEKNIVDEVANMMETKVAQVTDAIGFDKALRETAESLLAETPKNQIWSALRARPTFGDHFWQIVFFQGVLTGAFQNMRFRLGARTLCQTGFWGQ